MLFYNKNLILENIIKIKNHTYDKNTYNIK